MLPNTITLSVDVANNSTLVDVDYSRFDELLNRSVYNAEGHTYAARDTLNFYRTLPKRSGNSLGVAKSAFKITQDQEVPGVDTTTSLVAPLIADVSFSIPVGTTAAKVKEVRQRIIALLDDDTTMDALTIKLEY